MFQKILVPLDGSDRAEQAIPVAAKIARSTGASLVLLRVVTAPIDFAWYSMESPGMMQAALDADIDKAKTYLAGLIASETLKGITTSSEVIPGEPAHSIFPVAEGQHVDLVIMCSHGDTGMKRWMMGSISQKVARHSPIPVIILRQGTGTLSNLHPAGMRPVRIMVALDGSELAEATLEPAAFLSAALSAPAQGELHLTRVLAIAPDSAYDGFKDLITAEREKMVVGAKAYLQNITQRITQGDLAKLHLSITSSVIVSSDVADTLINVAETGEETENLPTSDVIAMATHGRSGPQRWMLGSITERVLSATRLPLLIVRPARATRKHPVIDEETTQHTEPRESRQDAPPWVGLF